MQPSDSFALYGQSGKLPDLVPLRAGSLTVFFEEGNLRYISYGDKELIRMIYPAVRTEGWLTVVPRISNLRMEALSDSFTISYIADYEADNVHFRAEYWLKGTDSGCVSFEMNGEALTTFKKNRIGFCVLHPLEGCVATPCTLYHADGCITYSQFPEYISPHQPFKELVGMEWSAFGEIQVRLHFEGDVFETEDHRNWTDASFKTYCTPLELPYPVELRMGERVYQKVLVEATGLTITEAQRPTVCINADQTKMVSIPAIGIGASTRSEPLDDAEVTLLKLIPFHHLRVDIYLFLNDWESGFLRRLEESKHWGIPLEVALFTDDASDMPLARWMAVCQELNAKVVYISVFHRTVQSTPDQLYLKMMPLLRFAFPGAKIGLGTNANFAQLNRAWPRVQADYLTYSVHPQEHAFDNRTIVENLAAQFHTVSSAKQASGNNRIHISPVNIQRRFNANLEHFEAPNNGSEVPPQVDARLMSLFGAGWTLGSLKYAAEAGAGSLTFFETVGERGIMQGDYDSHWPDAFPASAGMLFPVYHLFRYIMQLTNARVVTCRSSHTRLVECLLIQHTKGKSLLVANFTGENQPVVVDDIVNGLVLIRRMGYAQLDKVYSQPDFMEKQGPLQWDKAKGLVLSAWELAILEFDFE